ncbi:esterase [candidate division KSB1 bacterium]|nr:esterase [candidate division KSB1 bacterium]
MKKLYVVILGLMAGACLISANVYGQNRHPIMTSPEVNSDNTVTFRLFMPDAEHVVVSTQFVSEDQIMTRDEQGVWSITLGPVVPDIYPYSYVVDGVRIMDPLNPLYFPNERFKNSLVDIPGDTALVHSLQDVPHGHVCYRYYQSGTLDQIRPLLIYTPPGYDDDASRRYPVLYLIHGMTDTEETWFKVGRANFILDNMIALGKAIPMVIVMPYANTYSSRGQLVTREDIFSKDVFARDLIDYIMPFVENNYRVLANKANRAIAGFSLGGRQTLMIGLSRPDVFDWVCAYAPAVWKDELDKNFNEVYADPETLNSLKYFSLSCGTDDRLFNSSKDLMEALDARNISYETFFPSGGHTWMNCKLFLRESLKRLFK